VTGLPLRTGQQQVLSNLLRVRALVKATAAKYEQNRTASFLAACSVGNMDRMRLVRRAAAVRSVRWAIPCTCFIAAHVAQATESSC
jgi:hypothetical protein